MCSGSPAWLVERCSTVRTTYGGPCAGDLSSLKDDVEVVDGDRGCCTGDARACGTCVPDGADRRKKEYAAGVRKENAACRAYVAVLSNSVTCFTVYV
jgi:hypothetical protein